MTLVRVVKSRLWWILWPLTVLGVTSVLVTQDLNKGDWCNPHKLCKLNIILLDMSRVQVNQGVLLSWLIK